MKKRLLLLILCIIFVAACSRGEDKNSIAQSAGLVGEEQFLDEGEVGVVGVEGDNGERYFLGALELENSKFLSLQLAPQPSVGQEARIPSKMDLSHTFPKPGNQLRQNSCVGWAVGYAYKTAQEQIDQGWSVDTSDKIFSPSFVYNQINNGRDQGAYIHTAMQLVVDKGVSTMDKFPYSHFLTKPNAAAIEQAKKFKAKTWGTIASHDVDRIKRHIASGDGVVVGMPVYADFLNLSPSNPIYGDTSGQLAQKHGYHAIAMVGYDDSKRAFKIINSWGTNWGIDGYGWVSYDFFRNESSRIQVYTMVDIKEKVNNGLEVKIDSIKDVVEGSDIVIKGSNFDANTTAYIRGNGVDQALEIKSFDANTLVVKNTYKKGDYTIWVHGRSGKWSEGTSFKVVEKVVSTLPNIKHIGGSNYELIISGENFVAGGNQVYIRGNGVEEYMQIKSSTTNEIKVVNRYKSGVYSVYVKTINSTWSEPYYLRLY